MFMFFFNERLFAFARRAIIVSDFFPKESVERQVNTDIPHQDANIAFASNIM